MTTKRMKMTRRTRTRMRTSWRRKRVRLESGFLPFLGKIMRTVGLSPKSTVLPLRDIWARER